MLCARFNTAFPRLSIAIRTNVKHRVGPMLRVHAQFSSDSDADAIPPLTQKPPMINQSKPLTPESMGDLLDELLDASKFGTRGEAWFLAQMLLILLVAFPPNGVREIVDTIGGIGIVSGLTMIVLGSLALGQNLTPVPKPRDDHSLITNGIYDAVRHPMYGGIIVAALGLSILTGNEARLALSGVLFFVLNEKASYEEELLVERYGTQYEMYKQKTKKLIPWLF